MSPMLMGWMWRMASSPIFRETTGLAGKHSRHHDLFQSEAQRREGDSEVLDVCREDQFPFDGAVSEERHIIGDGAAFELVEFECALLVGHYADRIVDYE